MKDWSILSVNCGHAICRVLALVVLSTNLFSCINETGEESSTAGGGVVVINVPRNQDDNIQDISNSQVAVERIVLIPSVANEMGSIAYFFRLSDQLILVDKNNAIIVSVDEEGVPNWWIKGRPNDYTVFNSIEYATYDRYSNQLLIDDWSNIYVFTSKGEFVEKRNRPLFDYNVFLPFSNNVIMYSAQNIDNNILDIPKRQLLKVEDEKVTAHYINHAPQQPRFPTAAGFPEFFGKPEHLFYKAALRDTIYKIVESERPVPAYVVKFDTQESTDDVLRDPRHSQKLSYILERNIPFLFSLASNDEHLYFCYRDSERRSLAQVSIATGETVINSSFLQFQDWLFEAPLLEFDGTFFGITTVAEDIINQEHVKDVSAESATIWQKELTNLRNTGPDTEGKVVYLLKI